MPYLKVPGASLYYEVDGTGPLFLCISGANGSADLWKRLADQLKDRFTVIRYDRRGFSRSHLSGSQDYSHRIETDADDAARLIRHLSDEPATVLGNSSGAMVSLELVSRHPEVIRILVPHEPPHMSILPDHDQLWQEQNDIYEIYRQSGVAPAVERFSTMIYAGAEKPALLAGFDSRSGPFVAQNVMYWFERELLVYPFHKLDLQVLQEHKSQLLLANGESSNHEALQYRGNVVLAKHLGLELTDLPGMHMGFASHPKDFAKELLISLAKKDHYYSKML